MIDEAWKQGWSLLSRLLIEGNWVMMLAIRQYYEFMRPTAPAHGVAGVAAGAKFLALF